MLPCEVRCPADHTEPNGAPLRLSEPNCSLPCPFPEPIPYGYTNSSGEWRCEEGDYDKLSATKKTEKWLKNGQAMRVKRSSFASMMVCRFVRDASSSAGRMAVNSFFFAKWQERELVEAGVQNWFPLVLLYLVLTP